MSGQSTQAPPPASYSLDDIQTHPDGVLDECSGRYACPQCKKMVKFFCYHCYQVVGLARERIPTVHLPVQLTVFKHRQENAGKSTAVHAKVIAPSDVEIVTYPDTTLTISDPDRCLLLFPGPDARTLEEIDPKSFDHLLVIDGTWRQARSMAQFVPEFARLRKVTIQPRSTRFWRFQQFDTAHLATIEAIYFFYREYYEAYLASGPTPLPYAGQYDDLLFYYKYFYNMIQGHYRNNPKRTFSSRHKAGYIEYESQSETKMIPEALHLTKASEK
ncbi:hypothetical protein IWQ60_007578 [Tieghemiomyces parasiticus]|uniref:tRNA-uridine aminocarboxypropyltransferase 1 n=1 Tax=Tieghemiomyces parasiticus TaxID=78921 RepID=A0A9W8DTW7_9FUNG|nr:hypothetical protein IWQ60_007578 [Tieghemiomyces parasiticus]